NAVTNCELKVDQLFQRKPTRYTFPACCASAVSGGARSRRAAAVAKRATVHPTCEILILSFVCHAWLLPPTDGVSRRVAEQRGEAVGWTLLLGGDSSRLRPHPDPQWSQNVEVESRPLCELPS